MKLPQVARDLMRPALEDGLRGVPAYRYPRSDAARELYAAVRYEIDGFRDLPGEHTEIALSLALDGYPAKWPKRRRK